MAKVIISGVEDCSVFTIIALWFSDLSSALVDRTYMRDLRKTVDRKGRSRYD